jgi:outer membrane protein assembly factor BamA
LLKLLTLAALPILFIYAQPSSRTQEIEQERDKKTALLKPETVTKEEGYLRNFKDKGYLARLTTPRNGLRAKTGNLVTGSGFAIGPEYFRPDLLHGELTGRVSAQFSTRLYQKFEAEAIFPRLFSNRLNLDILATHRNYGAIDYYGNGPDSKETGRSNYRLEDTILDTILTYKPTRHIRVGPSLAYLWINVGPGTRTTRISTEKQFSVPGIDHQTNFRRTGIFAQYDYRDNPLGPKNGGNYVINYSWYDDQKLNVHNFRRMDIDLQQYIGFFNRTRVIALRAKGVFTESDRNETVPFYLQPFLGGSDDLRGFRNFRFSDRNMVIYNAEYRWEVFAGLDGALFVDAGKVSPRRGLAVGFKDLEASVGFGLRFNVRNATFMRLDTAFSHEGFRIWFKFNDVFNQRKFGTSTGQLVY